MAGEAEERPGIGPWLARHARTRTRAATRTEILAVALLTVALVGPPLRLVVMGGDSSLEEIVISYAPLAAALVFGYLSHRETLHSAVVGARVVRGIAKGQLYLCYQPKIDLATGELEAVEALVRWRHPRRGLLMPGDWIGDVERSPFSTPFNLWVLDRSLEQAQQWQNAGVALRIAVNLSPRCLDDPQLPAEIDRLLAKWQMGPESIELEVTERALENGEGGRAVNHLSGVGINLVLDDFGIGYSSLQRLVRLPLDGVKIDRSFVTGMGGNPRQAEVVRWAAELAKGLGLTLAAEGVETRESWLMLRSLGVDSAQGFLFAKPLTAAELEDWRDDRPTLVEA